MKKISLIPVLMLAAGAVAWFFLSNPPSADEQAPIATAVYVCDSGKHVSAAYFEGPEISVPPGEPPVPTGWIVVSFDGAASTTLRQTLSADGARFSNADESLVVWSKGDEVLVLHDSISDPEYANCVTRP